MKSHSWISKWIAYLHHFVAGSWFGASMRLILEASFQPLLIVTRGTHTHVQNDGASSVPASSIPAAEETYKSSAAAATSSTPKQEAVSTTQSTAGSTPARVTHVGVATNKVGKSR